MTVVFYLSGHGFGHAVRMAHVMRALPPEMRVHVRSAVPRSLLPACVRLDAEPIDSPVLESSDAIRIDGAGTVALWRDAMANSPAIVSRECEFVRAIGARLLVADVPYLAGEIAAATGIPCIAISNFTWDWILAPHLTVAKELRGAMESGYRAMKELWSLPFGPADHPVFRRAAPTPLVAGKPTISRRQARTRLAIANGKRVLMVAHRGAGMDRALAVARQRMPDALLLTLDSLPATGLGFEDLAESSDVIIGKLGYGLAASCSAHKRRLLYPPRSGFPEDEISAREARRYTCLLEIDADAFFEGEWAAAIEKLLDAPMPEASIASDGAEVCAARIAMLVSNAP